MISLHNPARVRPICISMASPAGPRASQTPAAAALRAACSARGDFVAAADDDGPLAAAARLNLLGPPPSPRRTTRRADERERGGEGGREGRRGAERGGGGGRERGTDVPPVPLCVQAPHPARSIAYRRLTQLALAREQPGARVWRGAGGGDVAGVWRVGGCGGGVAGEGMWRGCGGWGDVAGVWRGALSCGAHVWPGGVSGAGLHVLIDVEVIRP